MTGRTVVMIAPTANTTEHHRAQRQPSRVASGPPEAAAKWVAHLRRVAEHHQPFYDALARHRLAGRCPGSPGP